MLAALARYYRVLEGLLKYSISSAPVLTLMPIPHVGATPRGCPVHMFAPFHILTPIPQGRHGGLPLRPPLRGFEPHIYPFSHKSKHKNVAVETL